MRLEPRALARRTRSPVGRPHRRARASVGLVRCPCGGRAGPGRPPPGRAGQPEAPRPLSPASRSQADTDQRRATERPPEPRCSCERREGGPDAGRSSESFDVARRRDCVPFGGRGRASRHGCQVRSSPAVSRCSRRRTGGRCELRSRGSRRPRTSSGTRSSRSRSSDAIGPATLRVVDDGTFGFLPGCPVRVRAAALRMVSWPALCWPLEPLVGSPSGSRRCVVAIRHG